MSEPEVKVEEKRSEQRHEKKLVVVGTILQCDGDSTLVGCPVQCETTNISGHGLQFYSDLLLARGTILRVSIAYRPKEIFSVEGEVRWSKEENGRPVIGLQLHDNEETDFENWRRLIEMELERTKGL